MAGPHGQQLRLQPLRHALDCGRRRGNAGGCRQTNPPASGRHRLHAARCQSARATRARAAQGPGWGAASWRRWRGVCAQCCALAAGPGRSKLRAYAGHQRAARASQHNRKWPGMFVRRQQAKCPGHRAGCGLARQRAMPRHAAASQKRTPRHQRALPRQGAPPTGGAGLCQKRAPKQWHLGGLQCAAAPNRAIAHRLIAPI